MFNAVRKNILTKYLEWNLNANSNSDYYNEIEPDLVDYYKASLLKGDCIYILTKSSSYPILPLKLKV